MTQDLSTAAPTRRVSRPLAAVTVIALLGLGAAAARSWWPTAVLPAATNPEPAHSEDEPEFLCMEPDVQARWGVQTGQVREEVLVATVSVSARVAFDADRVAQLGVPLRGRVAALPVAQGAHVEAGDVLLQIDCPELGEAQSEFLRRQLLAAAAAPKAELAARAVARARELVGDGQGALLSRAEVERREFDAESAAAEARSAAAEAAAARRRLLLLGMDEAAIQALQREEKLQPQLFLKAPFAGVLIDRPVARGELVGPDRAAVLTVADPSVLWVLADVPESQIAGVREGNPARVRAGGVEAAGRVLLVGSTVDAASRTVAVRIALPDPPPGLRPGMFAAADIVLQAELPGPVLAVPTAAVQLLQGRPVLFVAYGDKGCDFIPQHVELGTPIGDRVPVLNGVTLGQVYVADNAYLLKAELLKTTAKGCCDD